MRRIVRKNIMSTILASSFLLLGVVISNVLAGVAYFFIAELISTDANTKKWLFVCAIIFVLGVFTSIIVSKLSRFRDYSLLSSLDPDAQNNFRLLQNVPTFYSVSDKTLAGLAGKVRLRSYAADALIIEEGNNDTDLYILVSGQVLIYRGGKEQGDIFEIRSYFTGDIFGEMAAINEQPRSANARAMVDTQVLALDRDSFMRALRNDTEVSIALLKALSSRMFDFDAYAAQLVSKYSEYERVVLGLLAIASYAGGKPENNSMFINMVMTDQMIAKAAGTRVDIVEQVLRKLTDEHLIRRDVRSFEVLDYNNLLNTVVKNINTKETGGRKMNIN